MRQLQGRDASFVARETRNSPMHIGSVLIYDPSTAPNGKVSFEDILAFIGSRLHLSKTVRERLVRVPLDLDYPYWVEDENFDLEYHVRHTALPKPGNWHQLCTLAARLFSRPLDLSRPPWEFTMVEGLGDIDGIPPGSFAMITKVHHAAIDGLSGIDLMEALHTLTPDATPPVSPDRWRPEPVPTSGELIGRFLLNAVQHPVQRVQVALQAAPGLVRIARGLFGKEFTVGEMVGPKTRFNTSLSRHRVIEGCRLPLADVKKIRSLSPGCWVNDVFLAIVGGALNRYLKAKHELPRKPLTSLVPVSVRNRKEKGDMGNQVAAMIVPLGTHLEDPAERLRYVHESTQNSKAMTNAIGARNLSEISQVSPALFLALGAQLNAGLGLTKQMSPPYSTLVTNVPGPRRPIYSAGAKLHTMMGLMCLTEGMGLAHVVQTYAGQATISFTADRELMTDSRFYASCIMESFEEMLAGARTAASAKRHPSEPADGFAAANETAAPPLVEAAVPARPRRQAKNAVETLEAPQQSLGIDPDQTDATPEKARVALKRKPPSRVTPKPRRSTTAKPPSSPDAVLTVSTPAKATKARRKPASARAANSADEPSA